MEVIGAIDDAPKYLRVQVAADSAFQEMVFDNGVASSPPADLAVEIDAELAPGMVFYARARWTGASLGESPWSETAAFAADKGADE